jgi:hypothetical protein
MNRLSLHHAYIYHCLQSFIMWTSSPLSRNNYSYYDLCLYSAYQGSETLHIYIEHIKK